MEPTTPSSAQLPPQPSQAPMPSDTAPRISKKMLILIGCVFLIFVFFFLSFLISSQIQKKSPQTTTVIPKPSSVIAPEARRWQITLSYSPAQQDLQLKKIVIEKGEAAAAQKDTSAYTLTVLDKSKKALYQSAIPVSERVLYDIYFPASSSATDKLPKQPNALDSIVTVPYLSAADSIQITKNGAIILEFAPLKDDKMSFIPQAYAEGESCKALSVVFISDGYSDMAAFHTDVENIKSALLSTAPYSDASSKALFNFKTVDNTSPLGCVNNGSLVTSCITDGTASQNIIKAAGVSGEMAYTKYIVLAKANPQAAGGSAQVLGATNAVGGNMVVIQTTPLNTVGAVHEIGGHAIGLLWDRYVDDQDYNKPDFKASFASGPKSNCSNNPSGEASWGGAGSGCTLSTLYAPTKPTCAGNGGILISGGSPDTVMSAASCFDPASSGKQSQFDTVERNWIISQLKNYEPYAACVARATTNTTPSTAVTGTTSATNDTSSLPPMATTIAQCPVKPAAGSPGTVEPSTFKPVRDPGNTDPDIFFGHYLDSFNKNDLYYTTGQANVEARFAGSNSRNPVNPEYRGMFYTRAEKPSGPERAGGYVYNPAWDWSGAYGEGSYTESGWSRVMAYTGDAEKGNLTKDRNCILATSVQRLIRDDKNTGSDAKYYTSSKMWYRVATPPTPTTPNSVIKVHVGGKPQGTGWYPSVSLYINQYKVKTWKNVGKSKPYPAAEEYIYPNPADPADANVKIGKINPSQVIVAIDDEHLSDDGNEANGLLLYDINIDGAAYGMDDPKVLKATHYDTKLESCVVQQGHEFENLSKTGENMGSFFTCGYVWFDYANALKDPYNSPVKYIAISADGSKGTGTVGGGDSTDQSGTGGATKPKQQFYSCAPDPACKAGSLGVQLCTLKCVPK